MKTFRRLSAPGSSALSIWQLCAAEKECTKLFGSVFPQTQNSFRLNGESLPFDEALLWRRETKGQSLTLECHLHGGYGVAAAFRDWMMERGWREVAGSLAEENHPALWNANSPLAARVVAAQSDNAFEKELQRIRDMPAAAQRNAVKDLAQWNAWASALEQPLSIVFAGPPNVGKSTLFNHWNRAALATIHDGQGTTRDAVEVTLQLGAPGEEALFSLTDTAGIGDGLSALDQQAMLVAWEQIDSAWKVIWVIDAAAEPSAAVLKRLQNRTAKDFILLNRTDLKESWVPSSLGIEPDLTGQIAGVDALLVALEAKILQMLGPPPPPGTLIAFKKSQREALEALLSDPV
ncbi:MAG: 50S ribosome-binding GTPase [Planctomycetota bacterium]|nr:50S ribosome-binding GTPase [Planctomycetota bacterium]MDA1112865.1 50S ribosome-binding GTPase [Planctomycetota bacterium]